MRNRYQTAVLKPALGILKSLLELRDLLSQSVDLVNDVPLEFCVLDLVFAINQKTAIRFEYEAFDVARVFQSESITTRSSGLS